MVSCLYFPLRDFVSQRICVSRFPLFAPSWLCVCLPTRRTPLSQCVSICPFVCTCIFLCVDAISFLFVFQISLNVFVPLPLSDVHFFCPSPICLSLPVIAFTRYSCPSRFPACFPRCCSVFLPASLPLCLCRRLLPLLLLPYILSSPFSC